MLYLILIISIFNTVLIIYLLKELRKEKDKIAELLDESISEKELRSELAKWNSARLKKATSNFVHYLNNEGTPRDFVNFILATKFGGQNALVALGAWKEFVIESFNQAWNLQEVKLNDHGFKASYIHRPSRYGHAFVEYAAEEHYSSLMAEIDLSDYKQAINISHNLFLENSTQAFGFVVIPYSYILVSHHSVALGLTKDSKLQCKSYRPFRNTRCRK